jgi:hypothetical protein
MRVKLQTHPHRFRVARADVPEQLVFLRQPIFEPTGIGGGEAHAGVTARLRPSVFA